MTHTIHTPLKVVAAIAIIALVGACAPTRTREAPGEYADDATVTAKVKTALIESPDVKGRQIDVETFRGSVQLNGFVDSSSAKSAATRVASQVGGVQEVHNNLEVTDKSSSPAEATDDAMITAKVKTALIAEPLTKARQINVTTEAGVVHLGGFVDNTTEKNKASEVARTVSGVKAVRNELEIKSSP
jgi:hyperosmotically inducible protein